MVPDPWWPYPMAIFAALTLVNAVLVAAGSGPRWLIASAAGLAGYLGAQKVVAWTAAPLIPEGALHLGMCALWLFLFVVTAGAKAWLVAFFYLASGATYFAGFALGQPIGHMSPVNIVAELFIVAAILSIMGGMHRGRAGDPRRRSDRRSGSHLVRGSVYRSKGAGKPEAGAPYSAMALPPTQALKVHEVPHDP